MHCVIATGKYAQLLDGQAQIAQAYFVGTYHDTYTSIGLCCRDVNRAQEEWFSGSLREKTGLFLAQQRLAKQEVSFVMQYHLLHCTALPCYCAVSMQHRQLWLQVTLLIAALDSICMTHCNLLLLININLNLLHVHKLLGGQGMP